MKRHGILNSQISSCLSHMGHTDTICICDCGLPIPETCERIDLALTIGVPSFTHTLSTILDDMKVEKVVLAEEIKENNPDVFAKIEELLTGVDVEIEFVPHASFKEKTKSCKAIVRTGEASPYANIILQSGCIFA